MVRRIPKVDLHNHLDGGLRPATITELAGEHSLTLPADSPDSLAEWFRRGAGRKDLSLYLEGFRYTVGVMQTREALERVAYELMIDLADEQVVYAEVRFAPVQHQELGLNLEQIVEAVLVGMERARRERGIEYGLILCAMRHQDPRISLEVAELAVAFRDRGVVGFDLAGDEKGHPPKKHLEAFQFIRNRNFSITIHAGDAFGIESIWQAVQICGAHRIGHATRLVEDMTVSGTRIEKMGSLAHFFRDKRIPMEVCLTSNVHTGAVESLDDHPFGIYYRNNFRVALCTDNRLMSATSLTDELELACTHFNLDLRDLEKLTINAMKSAFAHHDRRIRIIYDILKPRFTRIREMVDGWMG
jgi:adenosine deaminase